MAFGCSKKIWERNSKIRLLEDLRNLVVSVPAKLEGSYAKIVGVVGFCSVKVLFLKKIPLQFSPHGFQLDDKDLTYGTISILDGTAFSMQKLFNFDIREIFKLYWRGYP